MHFYQVSLFQYSKYIDNLYSYVSKEIFDIGNVVIVPFGKGNKILKGIIVEKDEKKNESIELKEIISLDNDSFFLSIKQVDLALWIRDKYMCSYYEAFRLFMAPSGFSKKNINTNLIYNVTNPSGLKKILESTRKNAHNKISLYKTLLKFSFISEATLREMVSFTPNKYLKELEEIGIISIEEEICYPFLKAENNAPSKIKLNLEQEKIYKEMIDIYNNNLNKKILLHGVTGSGKTLIYIQFIKYLIQNGKNAIILVPEISLTTQTIDRFSKEFGNKIAIMHSNLTPREKFDQWTMINDGKVNIVIGARSALFSPLKNIGAVIIDECHDEAYISAMSPKYDTVETAEKICQYENSALILGSATPTIKQYYMADKGKYHLFSLTKRANNMPLPEVLSVDMLKEIKNGNRTELSNTLQMELKKTIALGNQAILFLNRRGYSNYLTCDSCGYVPQCENCDITLTYHSTTSSLKCHYCGYEKNFTKKCPDCEEGYMMDLGTGTQKIESQVATLFPQATIFRMDKDTTQKRGMHSIILDEFKKTPSSILIGTQMIGKGHDFPKVTLVGIINADQGMNSPDYKALERSYSIIEQVGGRAGRDIVEGKVILQTFSPNNKLSYFIKNHDYVGFYNYEIENRRLFKYEPFGNLIKITVSSPKDSSSKNSSLKIQEAMNYYNEKYMKKSIKIFNHTRCIVHRIENKYRYQIVIKVSNENLDRCKKMINYLLTFKRSVVLSKGVNVSVDINPSNMI